MAIPEIQRVIPPGEAILWEGRPRGGLKFQGSDIFLTMFGLFFLVVSSVFVKAMFPFGLLLPHFWIGVYLSFGRFFVEAKRRSATRYALTNERIVIAKMWPRASVVMTTLKNDQQTTLTSNSNGTSNVTFGDQAASWVRSGTQWSKSTSGPVFEELDDPSQLLGILEARRKRVSGGETGFGSLDSPFGTSRRPGSETSETRSGSGFDSLWPTNNKPPEQDTR